MISQRFKKLRLVLLILALCCGGLAVAQIVSIYQSARQKLAVSRPRQNEIAFTKTRRPKINNQSVEIWQSTKNVRDAVRFGDSIFAATDGGLLQIGEDGEIEKHFTVLDGLPESDLTCAAVFGSKLFIGTSANGLLSFDGENFENYRWTKHETKAVTALLPDNGRMLIGTFAGGLLEFGGGAFREIRAENERIKTVNFLAKTGEILFVGTFDEGLRISENGVWRRFTVAEGLPSNRVLGVAAAGDKIFVGTDLGLAQIRNQKIISIAALPTLASLAAFDNQIFASRDDGEIYVFDGNTLKKLEWNKPPQMSNARFAQIGADLFLLGDAGAWRLRQKNSFGLEFAPATAGANSSQSLSSNVVSALALNGNIWAGTFRNGIDVLNADGKTVAHLENETVREINFLLANENQILAATSGGAVGFDDSFRRTNFYEDLPAKSIMQIAASGDEQVFATNRGLFFRERNGWRGIGKTNGLPSENVFTAAFFKNSLFVGTLGGLAQIENRRVVRTFTDANSKLTHNWITALHSANGRLFIGTYGGGVFELTASGELHSFAAETGAFAVNPNALASDGRRLYVGTLAGAWILDLETQKWRQLTDELPAQTVLSVAADNENVYFGTTNGIARIGKNFWRDEKF